MKLREDASAKAKELTIVPAGAMVMALVRRGDWRSVDYSGRTGGDGYSQLIKPAVTLDPIAPESRDAGNHHEQ